MRYIVDVLSSILIIVASITQTSGHQCVLEETVTVCCYKGNNVLHSKFALNGGVSLLFLEHFCIMPHATCV
jgi:hypothetical protein